jgi:hypothetical protein
VFKLNRYLFETDASSLLILQREVEGNGCQPKGLGVAGCLVHGSAVLHALLDGANLAKNFG